VPRINLHGEDQKKLPPFWGVTGSAGTRRARRRPPAANPNPRMTGEVILGCGGILLARLYVPSGDQISARFSLIAMRPSRLDVTRRHTDALTHPPLRGIPGFEGDPFSVLDDGPGRREAAAGHCPIRAKCSRARIIAGLSGFLTLSQSPDGPDR
jgi:hypothetical protein